MLIFAEMMQSFLLPPHPPHQGRSQGGHGGMSPPSEFGRKGEKEKEGRKGGNDPPHLSLEGGKRGRGKGETERGRKEGRKEGRLLTINFQDFYAPL